MLEIPIYIFSKRPVSNDYSLFSGAKQTRKAVYCKKFTAFFIKTIEFLKKVWYTVMAFEESKHPRDEDGKFTTKGNEGGKEYRQNTDYKQILKYENNSELVSNTVNKSLIKACKSLNKQIEKHTDKINNPQKIYSIGIINLKYIKRELLNIGKKKL